MAVQIGEAKHGGHHGNLRGRARRRPGTTAVSGRCGSPGYFKRHSHALASRLQG
ncbi:hypothetical protein D187_002950 [Cystobacter fuscus DSM 2262]|uniref:Uncharacterized protein n=1 Tax=Cystobacter fuscus (strain ATCC 25194 / DSM 2262 / NBRC 100088 / M29) TaxID=1242864 RepID=S9P4S1_CYSF2|nr:hypothetical protein D187_002950 [Cystobacter fuscus DSM 2262]